MGIPVPDDLIHVANLLLWPRPGVTNNTSVWQLRSWWSLVANCCWASISCLSSWKDCISSQSCILCSYFWGGILEYFSHDSKSRLKSEVIIDRNTIKLQLQLLLLSCYLICYYQYKTLEFLLASFCRKNICISEEVILISCKLSKSQRVPVVSCHWYMLFDSPSAVLYVGWLMPFNLFSVSTWIFFETMCP